MTDRTYTSTMFKALSSEYKGRVLIGEARKAEMSVFQQYGAESLPALLQVDNAGCVRIECRCAFVRACVRARAPLEGVSCTKLVLLL